MIQVVEKEAIVTKQKKQRTTTILIMAGTKNLVNLGRRHVTLQRNTTEKLSSSLVPPQQPSQQALLGFSDLHAKSKLVDEKPVLKGNLISYHVVKSGTTTLGTQVDPFEYYITN